MGIVHTVLSAPRPANENVREKPITKAYFMSSIFVGFVSVVVSMGVLTVLPALAGSLVFNVISSHGD
jgi:hypothetical protein